MTAYNPAFHRDARGTLPSLYGKGTVNVVQFKCRLFNKDRCLTIRREL